MDKDSKLIILFSSFVFLIIGGWYFNPLLQEAKNKQRCIDLMTKEFVAGNKIKKYSEPLGLKYLNPKETAFMAGYVKCNKLD
tara:strand:- start:727 stop:972 length:246 start_codon:yes stop_codon:yes gene_type:complete